MNYSIKHIWKRNSQIQNTHYTYRYIGHQNKETEIEETYDHKYDSSLLPPFFFLENFSGDTNGCKVENGQEYSFHEFLYVKLIFRQTL